MLTGGRLFDYLFYFINMIRIFIGSLFNFLLIFYLFLKATRNNMTPCPKSRIITVAKAHYVLLILNNKFFKIVNLTFK
jgi:hypothetical protein